MEFFDAVWNGIVATSWVEWVTFVTGLIYVVLAAKKSIWCWLFALISSGLFVYLCIVGFLYLESILQSFYVIMAIVGYLSWNSQKDRPRDIQTWSVNQHLLNILLSGVVALILGFLFDHYTKQAAPYVDAFTTVFSLAATFMVTRKVIGNWIYWIVIDLVSIYLYASRGLELLSVQMFIYTLLAAYGFISWRKELKLQIND